VNLHDERNKFFIRPRHPMPNSAFPRRLPPALRGCHWLRRRDVVTRHGDGDGSGIGNGGSAAAAPPATTVVAAPELRMWNVAASITALLPMAQQGLAEPPSPRQNRCTCFSSATRKLKTLTLNLQV
jgi:hypothetical protein